MARTIPATAPLPPAKGRRQDRHKNLSPLQRRSARPKTRSQSITGFRELSRDLLDVNEKICRARPLEHMLTPEKKNGRGDPGRDRARCSPAGAHLKQTGRTDLDAVEIAFACRLTSGR